MGRGAGAGAAPCEPDDTPTEANADNNFTVLACPWGHGAGAEDSDIERRTSKVSSHSLQRYS